MQHSADCCNVTFQNVPTRHDGCAVEFQEVSSVSDLDVTLIRIECVVNTSKFNLYTERTVCGHAYLGNHSMYHTVWAYR